MFAGLLLLTAPGFCEQKYVTRYDAFVGYTYLNSPALKLGEHGVHVQAGFRPKTWVSIGFDYSNARGDATLTPDLLLSSLRQTLGAQLQQLAAAGRLPAGYKLVVPTGSETQTFTLGPQLAFRKWEAVTLFLRPCIGYMREVAIPKPGDPIATGIVNQLLREPSGAVATSKLDWVRFYGAGGGFDLNLTRHFALRVQADYVWDHLYRDLLQDGRRTVRFSIGPAFNFGKNIVKD